MKDSLLVNEIFHSIQGESTRIGEPCVFVRLRGCHLRCRYCDTEYAFKEGVLRSVEEVLDEVRSHSCNLIEVTGGEPLLQDAVHPLMAALCGLGKTVLIETSGACDISICDPRVIRILDVKTPGSGESGRMRWENLDHLTGRDEVKFVICDRPDYEWAREIVRSHGLSDRVGAALFSPVFEQAPGEEIAGSPGLPLAQLARWILDDGLRVRLQPQLHKFIWDPQTRGV